jgi:hypothetical protein
VNDLIQKKEKVETIKQKRDQLIEMSRERNSVLRELALDVSRKNNVTM